MLYGENAPSKKFHREQVLKYMVEDGMLEADAIEKADQDLIEWSKPLPLPDVPDSDW